MIIAKGCNIRIQETKFGAPGNRTPTLKKRVNYTINQHTIGRFKVVAEKDMRKMFNIVANLMRRYVESRV